MSEDDLGSKINLDDIISIPSDVSGERIGPPIDYREWLPTWIAPGYYLKWVDIVQPEDQYVSTDEGGSGRF